jgi:hypothetical protein
MSLTGKKAQDFVVWLHIAKAVLPPNMTLAEAQTLFLRKLKEEEEGKNEKK